MCIYVRVCICVCVHEERGLFNGKNLVITDTLKAELVQRREIQNNYSFSLLSNTDKMKT